MGIHKPIVISPSVRHLNHFLGVQRIVTYKYTKVRRELCFTGHRFLKITPILNRSNPHNYWMQSTYETNVTYDYPHLPLNNVQRHRSWCHSYTNARLPLTLNTVELICSSGCHWKFISLIRKQKKTVLRKGVEVGSETVCPIHWSSTRERQGVAVLSEPRLLM
jgi:hypothetical protein